MEWDSTGSVASEVMSQVLVMWSGAGVLAFRLYESFSVRRMLLLRGRVGHVKGVSQ